MEKLNEITNEIFGLEESKNMHRNQSGIERLYEKMIELLVDNKKELSIAENELFSVVKYLGNSFGEPQVFYLTLLQRC